jgi:hypothetical protein
MQDRMLGQA